MTPATPPRSRERRSSIINESDSELLSPETPHRCFQGKGPVTPSTTTRKSHKELQGPRLVAPVERSPFKGFQSPEFTPLRELRKQEGEDLEKVSRVLFPRTSKEEILQDSCSSTIELLPPTRERSFNETAIVKRPKRIPGTPSHRLTNFELAKKWYNSTNECEVQSDLDDDSGEEDILIKKVEPQNPFQDCSTIDEETRKARLKSLLQSDPDIEDVITYVNKKGEVVKRHRLSRTEKEAFKPKRLFARELQELESGNKVDGNSNKD